MAAKRDLAIVGFGRLRPALGPVATRISTLRPSTSAAWPTARIVWEACGEAPDALALEHLATFPVDVRRRWPSVEKARRPLGWKAQIELPAGIAATVRWLREREVSMS